MAPANKYEPFILGNSWRRDESGEFVKPDFTLGYECLRWCYRWLKGPKGPWQFTPEQARLVLWWYAVDENGTWLYEEGTIQRIKGWGKGPWIAAIAAFEMLGPCTFSHFGKDGEAVGKRHHEPWIQIAAVNQAQTRSTMKLFRTLFTDAAKKHYQIKPGAELILAEGGFSRIEGVTSSPASLEGHRPSLFLSDETHWWTKSTDGPEMAAVGRLNAEKQGRSLSITNAYRPSQGSVAQSDRESYDKIMAGELINTKRMYDTLEVPQHGSTHPDEILPWLEVVRGDSYWVNIEKYKNRMLDIRIPLSRTRRMYYNQIVASEDALFTPAEWDGAADRSLRLEDDDEIVLGFDGARSADASALVAIRVKDRAVFLLGLWEPITDPRYAESSNAVVKYFEGELDMAWVTGRVERAFSRYKVVAFFSDVHPIDAYVNQWSDKYREKLLVKATPGKSAVGYDMRGTTNSKALTTGNMALVSEIREGVIKHHGHTKLREHALNAFQAENGHGMSFSKESKESLRKVDAYAAMLLAYLALTRYLESGKKPTNTSKKLYVF